MCYFWFCDLVWIQACWLLAGPTKVLVRNSCNLLQHQCLQWGGKKKPSNSVCTCFICIFLGNCFLCFVFVFCVHSGFTLFFGLLYQKRLRTEVGAKYMFLFPLESKKYICTGKCAWASQARRFNIEAIRSTVHLTRRLPLLVPFLFTFLNSCFETWHMAGV